MSSSKLSPTIDILDVRLGQPICPDFIHQPFDGRSTTIPPDFDAKRVLQQFPILAELVDVSAKKYLCEWIKAQEKVQKYQSEVQQVPP